MPLDAELPLWTIRPNWSGGVLERLKWLTDVLASTYGVEQRRALRLSPRREFELTFNPTDAVRSYFELWLHRLGSVECMLPLFHDRGRLTAGIANGATVIPVDTTNREFAVGELALLLGDDPFTYNRVEITAVAAGQLTVEAGGVTQAWGKGASIYPLRRARLDQESVSSALTNRVGQATLLFELNQASDLDDEGEWGDLYGGYPVMLDKPNRREVIDLTFIRNSLKLDNDHGLRAVGDEAGRAFTVQTYMKMLRGRAQQKAFRQFLYRLRGQQGAIWVPSYNEDFVLTQPAAALDTKLDVKKIGYAYTGGAVSGRRHVLLNGTLMKEVTGTGVAPSTAEERLNISGTVGSALLAGVTGSFMDTCRLATDDIEITHHTDSDGLAECSFSFRSFRDERVAPAIISSDIPETLQTAGGCGGDPPVEPGEWILKMRYVVQGGVGFGAQGYGGQNISFTPQWYIGGSDHTSEYYDVDGLVHVTEYTWANPLSDLEVATADATVVWWQRQHGWGSVIQPCRGWHEYKWYDTLNENDDNWIRAMPHAGTIDAQTAIDGTFKVRHIWPDDVYFYMTGREQV